jgi:TonB family protein
VADQRVIYVEPEVPEAPPVERPAEPVVPAEAAPAPIEVPVDIVRLSELPKLPATSVAVAASELAGILRRGPPVVAAPAAPGAGQVFLAAQVEVPVSVAKGSPTPRYPAVLASTGIVGEVRVRFVVDTAGRVEMATVEEVRSAHAAFSQAVWSTLPRMRFTPATAGGTRVRQLVELPFLFRSTR